MVTCIKPSNSDREPITTSIGYGFTAWAFLDSWTFLDEACKRIKNAAQTPYTSIGTHTVRFPVRHTQSSSARVGGSPCNAQNEAQEYTPLWKYAYEIDIL